MDLSYKVRVTGKNGVKDPVIVDQYNIEGYLQDLVLDLKEGESFSLSVTAGEYDAD